MKTLKFYFSLLLTTITFIACAQDVSVKLEKLSDHVYILVGQGGNMAVSVGDDGVLVVDDQYPQMTQKIITAIKTISDKPIRFVINTHYHHDHTGGNENIANIGATIISHENVRERLDTQKGFHGKMESKNALPVITYDDNLNIHVNGEKIIAFHLSNAHTNGDSMLYFTKSNVLHTGDIYFNGMYPYIDLTAKGSVEGYINAVKNALMLIDDDTKIIPGHGKLSNKKEYQFFLNMLETLKKDVLTEIEKGKTEDEVVTNTSLTKTFDDLGYSWNFITSEKIRRTFYSSLKN